MDQQQENIMRYEDLVDEVCTHLKCDIEKIRALAIMTDTLRAWENPDDVDYQAPLTEIPKPFMFEGEMRVNKYRMANFEQDFAAEVFSHEMREQDSLHKLAVMYKRLKQGVDIPEVVFQNIISKMFWLCANRKVLVT